VSVACIDETVVCMSSSRQQRTLCASRCLNIASRSGDLMTVVSVVCVVDDDDDDDGRINFNVAYSPKTARTCNS